MTLDEIRDALEMAKLSQRTDQSVAVTQQIIDWAERITDFLEAVHAPAPEVFEDKECGPCGGHGHVCEQEGNEQGLDQVWIACPVCKGRGKVKQAVKPSYPVLSATEAAKQKLPCEHCKGTGEETPGVTCIKCGGTGTK